VLNVAEIKGALDGAAIMVTGLGVTAHGNYGDLTIKSDGSYDYVAKAAFDALNLGQSASDTFNFKVSDGSGDFDNTTLTFNIDGINEEITGGDTGTTINGSGGIDTINANGGNDTVNAGAGNDSVDGGSGNDVLNGDEGNDSLIGGSGTDLLRGGIGEDSLDGGSGNDILIGGADIDQLTGGSGNDLFQFNGPGGSMDEILDFFRTQDKIQVDKSDFGFTTLVVTSNAGGVAAGAGVKQFVYDETSHILYYDNDGSTAGGATAIAHFNASVTALNTSDFIVIT
jgi:VCBS repeat-containing protein